MDSGNGYIQERLIKVSLYSNKIPDDGQNPKKNAILSVIHHRQNPSDSTNIVHSCTSAQCKQNSVVVSCCSTILPSKTVPVRGTTLSF
jgi:hypothetical protein